MNELEKRIAEAINELFNRCITCQEIQRSRSKADNF